MLPTTPLPCPRGSACGLLVLATLLIGWAFCAAVPAAQDERPTVEVGTNIALGRPYTLQPAPSYALSADPGDTTHHLTDGETTTSYFWTQPGTVGWQNVAHVAITVDLGRVEPIGGVALNTAAGRAQVTWPAAIPILVSDDGEEYRLVGDLVALDHAVHGPWPDEQRPSNLNYAADGYIDSMLEEVPSQLRYGGFDVHADNPLGAFSVSIGQWAEYHDELRLADLTDGYITLGPIGAYRAARVIPDFYTQDTIEYARRNFPGPTEDELTTDQLQEYLRGSADSFGRWIGEFQ